MPKRLQRSRLLSWVVPGCALVAVLVRLPLLTAPLSPDEGGFLLIAGQWHAGGGSLYGAYWVDRPPLLIVVFALAHDLGGTVALRLLGAAAASLSVILSARIGQLVGGAGSARWAAVAGAAFVTTPLFNAHQVSGELLAVPWVLGGIAAFLASRLPRSDRSRNTLLLLAGACAAGSFLVKQSFADTFVFVLAFAVVDRVRGRSERVAGLTRELGLFALGTLTMLGVVLAGAATRGTTPLGIWDSVVVFRAEAGNVIASSASSSTMDRLSRYPAVLLASGALALLVVMVADLVRRRATSPLAAAALGTLAWESAAIALGGSYWLHYLLGLIPGLVLATALLTRERGRLPTTGRALVAYALAAAVLASAFTVIAPPAPSPSQVAGEWLAAHEAPGDTAVVAFGQPNVLAEADAQSPYELLWSLPVRVRDPHLRELSGVLNGTRAPVWLLIWRGQLASWGISPHAAQVAVKRHYRAYTDVCGYVVYLRKDVHRPHQTRDLPGDCTASAAGEPT